MGVGEVDSCSDFSIKMGVGEVDSCSDSCIKMGSDESHFNVSLIVWDKVTRQTTGFEEKGEPKRIRTEVPLITSITPYR